MAGIEPLYESVTTELDGTVAEKQSLCYIPHHTIAHPKFLLIFCFAMTRRKQLRRMTFV